MSIYNPFTYLIGWTTHNKWYYGVRYAKNCNPTDLWTIYFTSSKHVKNFRKSYGEPDVIEIRKIFDTKDSAILWEEKVLKKLNVRENALWLNKTDSSSPPIYSGKDNSFYGKKHSEDVMDILRRPKTEETKIKLRKPKTTKVLKSDDHRSAISKAHIGIGHTEETKQKLSIMNEKYRYKIQNISTNEIYETTNLTKFCKDHLIPKHIYNNLVRTWLSDSGGYKIIERTNNILIKERVILENVLTKERNIIDDLREYCKLHKLNLSNLRRTSPTYTGKNKVYTSDGYKII